MYLKFGSYLPLCYSVFMTSTPVTVGQLSTQENVIFTVVRGLQPHQIMQLIAYANTDHDVRRFTSDARRFKDAESYAVWLKKGRTMYALTDVVGELYGVVWFGKEALPVKKDVVLETPEKYTLAIAIRIYGAARGKHLANELIAVAKKDFFTIHPELLDYKFWLEVSADNAAAIATYKKLGMVQISQPDSAGKILMVESSTPGLE